MILRLLSGFILLASSAMAATPIADNAKLLHSQLVKVLATKKVPARDVIQLKPLPVASKEEIVLKVKGTREIPLADGQRSCESIQADWIMLDALYVRVNALLLEIGQNLTDESLNRLKVATEQLARLSDRLNGDGGRRLLMHWTPDDIAAAMPEGAPVTLAWNQLVYVNVDGASKLDSTATLKVNNPIEKGGITLEVDVSAERVCSDSFEVRLDGRGLIQQTGMPQAKARPIPLYVSLL